MAFGETWKMVNFFGWNIVPDKKGIYKCIFLFLHRNIYCGYWLEVLCWGTSNEYQQHMFLWRNKKFNSSFQLKKTSALSGV